MACQLFWHLTQCAYNHWHHFCSWFPDPFNLPCQVLAVFFAFFFVNYNVWPPVVDFRQKKVESHMKRGETAELTHRPGRIAASVPLTTHRCGSFLIFWSYLLPRARKNQCNFTYLEEKSEGKRWKSRTPGLFLWAICFWMRSRPSLPASSNWHRGRFPVDIIKLAESISQQKCLD